MDATRLLLLTALLAAPLVGLVGWWRTRLAAPAAVVMAAFAFGAALWGWHDPGDPISREWAPSWGLRLEFRLDGLATMYALLATGVGLAVVLYATCYLPSHLHHEHQPPSRILRFFVLILLFMGAMTGLVMAQDALLLFLFWDLTAVASYFLIGFDNHKAEARSSALMALIVTGTSAVAILVGFLMLGDRYGTTSLAGLFAAAESSRYVTVASALVVTGAIAKSAQVPFHFWLPRAMAAPTPVSAYLHSAAMVAAGVFLVGRIWPLVDLSGGIRGGLMVVGVLSMLVGGLGALSRDNLKQILAYSTIGQYGYVVFLFGLGGEHGVYAATFYVIAHALAKSALFLTAGAVTEATGVRARSLLGGLARDLPLLALGSGLAAATLAALPLTIGFFKDELFFDAALEHGPVTAVIAVIAAGMTAAYMARFWSGIFLFDRRARVQHPLPILLILPPLTLGITCLVGGIWPGPFAGLAAAAAGTSLGKELHPHLGYHLGASPANLMAIAAFALGAALLLAGRALANPLQRFTNADLRFGPEGVYRAIVDGLNDLSDRIHWIEVRDLRSRVTTVLVPAAILVGAGLLASRETDPFRIGTFEATDIPVALLVLLGALAALTAAVPRDHFSMALALSGVGFSLASAYAMMRAPDVALVAVLIETIFGLLFFALMSRIPRGVDHREVLPADDPDASRAPRRVRDAVLGVVAGTLAFVVVWGVLSRPSPMQGVIDQQIALTDDAHGRDVVTVILADFRGFDTMGEITVITIAMIGIATLLAWRGRDDG